MPFRQHGTPCACIVGPGGFNVSQASSLFSPNWFRVAELYPRLGSHIQIRRQPTRDSVWYVLTDSVTGRQHRLNATGYQFVGRCNGKHTTTAIWKSLLTLLGEDAPTQDDIVNLIGQLSDNGLLQVDKLLDVETLFDQHSQRSRQTRRSKLNPFMFRVDLFDPTTLLRRFDRLGRVLFNLPVLLLWGLIMLATVGMVVSHWPTVQGHAALYMLTPRYLILTWLCFPCIKALHEMAHGMAVRRWGGDVPHMGIALLLMVPAPYVDASAASAFRFPYQRAMVSAAGIMAELTIAAAAFFIWLSMEPGILRDLAFVTAFIGSISTVMFNGNPLMRFDGYYVLSDALDLPNLASRSQRYWMYLLQRYVLSLKGTQSPMPERRERFWLLIYAPLSWCYRVLVGFSITFWLASQLFPIAVIGGLYLLYGTVLVPVFKAFRFVFFSPALGTLRLRGQLLVSMAAICLVVLIGFVPLPASVAADGVVWLPEHAMLRAETDGFVREFLVRDGERVESGQVVAVLDDPKLRAHHQALRAKLDALLAEEYQSFLSDTLKTKNRFEATESVQVELARVEERLAQLQLRAETSGHLVLPNQDDRAGTFIKRGALLGYVFKPDDVVVRAIVDEHDVAALQYRVRAVNVMLSENPGVTHDAVPTRSTPLATNTLPSPALGDRGGGRYPTDPKDEDGVKTLETVFELDLTLPAGVTPRVGGHAWVRFYTESESLAARLSRRTRQLFLKHFDSER